MANDLLKDLKIAANSATLELEHRQTMWGLHQGEVHDVETALMKVRRNVDQLQQSLDDARNAEQALKLQQIAVLRKAKELSDISKEAQRVKLELDRMVERLEPTVIVDRG
jgi:predicted  nucleic acid-binding Zn-ribbon protein